MIKKALTMIKAECLPFGFKSNYIEAYRRFYNLQVNRCTHEYGYIEANGYNLFVQRFKPINSIETVLLIHGYLDHAASLNKTINHLVKNGYEVICYDLPGHGLSSGERATITSFEDYIKALKDLSDKLLSHLEKRPLLVAHSTGALIALEFISENKHLFAKVALIAPLFRPYLWTASKVGLFITKPFSKKLKRIFQINSHDQQYLTFTKRDPLQEKKLPVTWLYALQAWLKTLKLRRRDDLSFLMIQGNLDKTVDLKHGLKKVKYYYPKSKIILMDNGHHQLLNESRVIREQTFSILLNYLKEK
ncbi:alpha/beta hydrolase [Halalkalibacter akibai]|uniref:Lysophospholipase n=1 Tax=Halalkalibacter akibai (strain ATCC 43226 / DSM 21942 / CIP 109018 / JCM 9157 / 1139) TaxID=1236973 RepID=W4QWC1_HALA3|nr:alpha/beta hydrolase [Halalkalibacter akibai]GAE36410.1 lysophospholipase [Halalkalibacter akibai JCM 9157]